MRGWRKKWIAIVALPILILIAGVGGSYRLTVGRYAIRTPKLEAPVRLLLITDLHSCLYGKEQEALVRAIEAERPDALMFVGDIADDKMPRENTQALLEAVAKRYPCFYVTGNHEYWGGDAGGIKRLFRRYGVTVLEGAHAPFSVRGQKIVVCGVDDPQSRKFTRQLAAAARGAKTGPYSVLLSHRPELFERYVPYGFDLVLSGHAHGGLWRIPGLLDGFVAPNQGFFPKYTSGTYEGGSTTMILSRGLARESTRIPRFFNPVELVVADLLPLEADEKSDAARRR